MWISAACEKPPTESCTPWERQAAIAERAIARYRDAKPRTGITNETIRLVCNRLCRSTDLVNGRLTTKTTTALAALRQVASVEILKEFPDHTPALFVKPELLKLWTRKDTNA